MKILLNETEFRPSNVKRMRNYKPQVMVDPSMAEAIYENEEFQKRYDKIKKELVDRAEPLILPSPGVGKRTWTKLYTESADKQNKHWKIYTKTDKILDKAFCYFCDKMTTEEFKIFAKTTLDMSDEDLQYYCNLM